MTIGRRVHSGWFAIPLLAAAGFAAANDALDADFDKDVAIIVANANACHRFDIYLALTDDQQRQGLMFVTDLAPTTGMLFVYRREQPRSMWMKNTYLPLDIAFTRADGTVINIAYSTEPQSLRSIRSSEPGQYVLELNAGIAQAYDIGPGSRVLWGPIF